MDDMTAALARAHAHATEFLDGLDRRSVAATASLSQLRRRLGVALTADGVPAAQVIDELVAATDGGHLGSGGGRFFAWVVGGAMPSALAADWLVDPPPPWWRKSLAHG
jgi:hypothetical protein